MRLIDPPDLLSGTIKDWQDFLSEMQAIEPKDDDVRDAIENAKKVIEEMKTPAN